MKFPNVHWSRRIWYEEIIRLPLERHPLPLLTHWGVLICGVCHEPYLDNEVVTTMTYAVSSGGANPLCHIGCFDINRLLILNSSQVCFPYKFPSDNHAFPFGPIEESW